MKRAKITLICLLISTISSVLMAQQSPFDSYDNFLFKEASSFYQESNYAAASRFLNEYLLLNSDKHSYKAQQANEIIAMSAYILRKDDAQIKLETYTKEYPYASNSDIINLYIGILEFEDGKYKNAIKRFEEINETKLDNEQYLDLLFYRGYSYIQIKKFKKASYEFSELLKHNSQEYKNAAHYYYGYCQYRMQNHHSALENLLIVENDANFSNSTPYLLCQLYFLTDNCEKAQEYGLKLNAKENQYSGLINKILGVCAFNNKDYNSAIEYLTKYQEATKRINREDWYMLGIAYFQIGNYNSAITSLSKATTKKDKLSQNAYFHIGLCYLKNADKKNARLSFENASKMDFDMQIKEDALYNYALATYELSYSPFNESATAFERFLKEFPNSKHTDQIYKYLVDVYLTTTNYQQAYKSIQKLNSDNKIIQEARQRVMYGMATTAIANRKYGPATKIFTALLKEKSYNDEVFQNANFWYGECLYRARKYDNAQKHFNIYLKKETDIKAEQYALAHYNIAYCYLLKKDYTNATTWYRKFIQVEKSNKTMIADAYNRIGDCYFQKRDFKQAVNMYTKTLNEADGVTGVDYALYQSGFVLGLQKKYSDKIDAMQKLILTYPKSAWADDAMYETGRAYVSLNDNVNAIKTFNAICVKYDKLNPLVRKSKLEIAMLQYNMNKIDEALSTYKEIIAKYPNTEEATTSIETVESILVDNNRVDEYKTIVKAKGKTTTTKEDSLSYKACEKLYFKQEFALATTGLSKYITTYPQGKYISMANYYLANCYFKQDKKQEALDLYNTILEDPNNPNIEFTLQRISSITFDLQKYDGAIDAFNKLNEVGSKENKLAAITGLLRAYYTTNDYTKTIETANTIITNYSNNTELVSEAQYYKVKSLIAQNQTDLAFNDIKLLSQDTRTSYGAECKYLLAKYYFDKTQLKEAENEIFDYINKGTPHQHWLAKSFILLADIYIHNQNYFEAKQYLLSLKENYGTDDLEITTAMNERFAIIEKFEDSVVATNNDTLQIENDTIQ